MNILFHQVILHLEIGSTKCQVLFVCFPVFLELNIATRESRRHQENGSQLLKQRIFHRPTFFSVFLSFLLILYSQLPSGICLCYYLLIHFHFNGHIVSVHIYEVECDIFNTCKHCVMNKSR